MPLSTKARDARRDQVLAKQLNYSAYGVLTLREYLERSLTDGCHMKAVEVRDEAATAKAQREYDILSSIPFGNNPVPIGNLNHPRTIHYYEVKDRAHNGVFKTEYYLYRPNGNISVINKTGYDYWNELKQNRNRQIEDTLANAPILEQVPFPKDAKESLCAPSATTSA